MLISLPNGNAVDPRYVRALSAIRRHSCMDGSMCPPRVRVDLANGMCEIVQFENDGDAEDWIEATVPIINDAIEARR